MQTTKLFRYENSQAILIPDELAFVGVNDEMEIERVGDELRVRPARRSLAGALDSFARFGHDYMAHGREDQE
jgi:antitoxin VapB